MSDMEKQADKANRMPSFENTFRNLNLNQRVSTMSPFVSKTVWDLNGRAIIAERGIEWFGGLDLSARTDLTSFVVLGINPDGMMITESYFWTPEIGLLDRAKLTGSRMTYGCAKVICEQRQARQLITVLLCGRLQK